MTPLEIEELRNLPLKDIINKLGIRPWQIPRLLVKGRKEVRSRMGKAKIFKGIDKQLEDLSAKYPLYMLSTNDKDNIEALLKRCGINQHFQEIYGGIGVMGKPKALRSLVKKHGLDINSCVYVGDETRDIAAARRVGMKIISVGWGFSSVKALKKAGTDKLVNKPADLAKAVEEIFRRN